jgi:succinylglutamate desuccinylase
MLEKQANNIYKIQGQKSGTNIIVLGGVHGDEQTGLAVVNLLMKMFLKKELKINSGSIVLALGNEKAIAKNSRCGESNINLNRCFTKELLAKKDNLVYEIERAQLLARLMSESDILLDIHSTKLPSRAFLACQNSPRHQDVHKWFDADTVVTDDNFVLSGGECSTTDEYMNELNKIGVCFETGCASDVSKVDDVVESIKSIMAEQDIIEYEVEKQTVVEKLSKRKIYDMDDRIELTKKDFHFIDDFGTKEFAPVTKGQIVGYVGDTPYRSNVDGVVLFQTPMKYWRVGDSVGYIAQTI